MKQITQLSTLLNLPRPCLLTGPPHGKVSNGHRRNLGRHNTQKHVLWRSVSDSQGPAVGLFALFWLLTIFGPMARQATVETGQFLKRQHILGALLGRVGATTVGAALVAGLRRCWGV